MAGNVMETPTGTSPAVQRELARLRETTARVVGSVFYGTLLKMMRESKLQGPYGHGGRGEEIFAAQLDGILAERMGTAARGGLRDVLYHALEEQQALISTPHDEREKG